jgi:hypothetical protein
MTHSFNPSTLSVGDTAYISLAYGSQVAKGTVVKVTPSGQIVVERAGRKTRFDKQGREIGAASRWYADALIDQESYDSRIEGTLQRKRTTHASAIQYQLSKLNFQHASKAEILNQIDRLRAAVEKI